MTADNGSAKTNIINLELYNEGGGYDVLGIGFGNAY
jgi:hypothetical protein